MKPQYRKWGATTEEVPRRLPGDELARQPRSQITCAVTIQAQVGQVWPWQTQTGCQPAGWYRYDLLDNCDGPQDALGRQTAGGNPVTCIQKRRGEDHVWKG